MKNSFHNERSVAKELAKDYRLYKKQRSLEIIWVLMILIIVSILIWLGVKTFNFERVPWSQAFTAVLSLGVAIIAYRQWIAARHEISIDKYYDRLDTANRRLELLYSDEEHKKTMHVFAQLDKMEYIIIKYELGYISPLLARRAILNFKAHCEDLEFCTLAFKWIKKAAYLPKTQELVQLIHNSSTAKAGVPYV